MLSALFVKLQRTTNGVTGNKKKNYTALRVTVCKGIKTLGEMNLYARKNTKRGRVRKSAKVRCDTSQRLARRWSQL